jgi:hypothetical protein
MFTTQQCDGLEDTPVIEMQTQIPRAHWQEAYHLIWPVIQGIKLHSTFTVAKCVTGSVWCCHRARCNSHRVVKKPLVLLCNTTKYSYIIMAGIPNNTILLLLLSSSLPVQGLDCCLFQSPIFDYSDNLLLSRPIYLLEPGLYLTSCNGMQDLPVLSKRF